MRARLATLALLLGLAAGPAAGQQQGGDMQCQLTEDTERKLLQQSVQAFALTAGGGWRELYQAGCTGAAAKMIERYIEAHPDRAASHPVLHFQAGQLRAFQGNRAKAVVKMESAIAANERGRATHGKHWSTYVAATIAFLEDDKSGLKRLYERLRGREDTPPGAPASYDRSDRGDPQHIAIVKGLIDCFEKNYEAAFTRCRER